VPAAPDATDESALLPDEAAEFGIASTGPPAVERRDVPVGDGSELGTNAPFEPAAAVAAFAGA
jgi:hypothetical protein